MPKTLIEQNPKFDKKIKGKEKLAISEMFSDTIQGEGVTSGVVSTFVRLQGCTLRCVWCFPRGTKILMGDFQYKNIEDVKIGDIIKTYNKGLKDTTVLNHMLTRKTNIVEVSTDNNNIVCSDDHNFPSYSQNISHNRYKSYTKSKDLKGKWIKEIPDYNVNIEESENYKTGYIKGVTFGDAHFQFPYRIKLECVDEEMIKTYFTYIKEIFNYEKPIPYKLITPTSIKRKPYYRGFISNKDICKKMVDDPNNGELDGFITGFFDAEGHCSRHQLSMSQNELETLKLIETRLNELSFNTVIRDNTSNKSGVYSLEILGGYKEYVRFFKYFNPKIKRKSSFINTNQKFDGLSLVKKVEEKGVEDVYSMTTEEGHYIAGNFLVKNCDTIDVWPNGNEYSFDEIFKMWEDVGLIERFKDGQHLILTGGSPLKQQKQLIDFIRQFIDKYGFKPYIEVENEAVLLPLSGMLILTDQWNNSPKLMNSGMKERARLKPGVLEYMSLQKNSWFKFVISNDDDWDELDRDFLQPGYIKKEQIILMPEGQTQAELELTRELTADMAIKHGTRFSDRQHVTIWNQKTGV